MKILKLSPYFYPEKVSSSHLTDDLNVAFAEAGFTQENYVPMPSRGVSAEVRKEYQNKKQEMLCDGTITVHRFPMFREGKNSLQRAFRYVLVNLIQLYKGVRAANVDVLFAGSTPPTQGLLCSLVKRGLSKKYKRNVPFVYNLQDIFPDSLVNAKMTKKGSLIWKIGRKIEDYTYRNADKIIVISEDFKRNIMEKGVPEEKIVIVPNWVNTDNVYPVKREDNILFDRYGLDRNLFYICYSGNIGHSQNMDLLLHTAKQISETIPKIRFVLIGEGAAKEAVEKKIKEDNISNVILLPFQPYEDIAHVFSLGDVGLVISKPGIGGSSVPSKTFSIMAAGRPILASFDEDSALCQLLKNEHCGMVTDPESEDSLISGVKKLYCEKELRCILGENGRRYVTEVLDKDRCTKQYVDVIREQVCEVEKV